MVYIYSKVLIENMVVCSVYFHQPDYKDIVARVKAAFPKANILISEPDDSREILIELKTGLFSKRESLTLNYRQRHTPGVSLEGASCGVSDQMRGMYNFVAQLPADNPSLQSLLLAKIQTINVELSFRAEPKLNSAFRSFLQDIVRSYEAFIFAQPGAGISQSDAQQFLDKDFNLLIDTGGECGNGSVKVQISSEFIDKPFEATADQEGRKKKSEQFLQEKGIMINVNLPFIDPEAEVNLRTKEEIIERVYALALISALGEGVPRDQLERVKNGLPINELSPYETHLYTKGELTPNEKAIATWRYESMNLLLWALGYVDPLVHPDAICDVGTIVGLVIHRNRQEFEAGAALKSKAEILDELDKTYRMNWACVQARLTGGEPGGGIHAGIVYERHYALNWLTRYQDYAWDDVSTDT
jgi:hypothetical protein